MKTPTTEQWAMVLANDRLLRKWAFEATPRGLNHDRNCIQESYDILLMQAIRASTSYRKELGLTFGTYIGKHIKKLAYRHWEVRNRKSNRPASLSYILYEDNNKEMVLAFARTDRSLATFAEREDVANAIKDLPKRHRRVIEMWAGIGCRQRTEEQISKAMRISRCRVWQLKHKAFAKIKLSLTKGSNDY